MDFSDQIKQHIERVKQLYPNIKTEEATKQALILPFFQILGYDVFNPMEFVPEFTADVGIKKGERVDYAIIIDSKPVILIEAKWCGEPLDNHASQLFRYFATTEAKFGILTNGLQYRFYTDLDEENKMDMTPFMEFDIINLKDAVIPELKRFQRNDLDVDGIFSAASDLKYTSSIKALLARQYADPDEDFVRYVLGEVYPQVKTRQIVEKFKPIVKRSFAQYISELLSDRFKVAIEQGHPGDDKPDKSAQIEVEANGEKLQEEKTKGYEILTSTEELESWGIIKALLCDIVSPDRVQYKDTKNYFSIVLDGKTTKWICRLYMNGEKKSVYFPKAIDCDWKRIESPNDLFTMKELFIKAVESYGEEKQES